MKDQYGILEDISLPDRLILKSNRIEHLRGIIASQNDIVNLINQIYLDQLLRNCFEII